MKKIIFMIALTGSFLSLQSQAFEIGKSYVSLGYGVGNFTQSLIKAAVSGTDTKYSSFGPAFLKYEYGISDKVGIGVNVAYLSASVSATDNYTDANNKTIYYTDKVQFNTTSILGRVNFHFGENEKIDPYFGFGMGYRNAKWTYSSSDPNAPQNGNIKNLSPFGMEITFGCRFLLMENLGIYTEVGMAKAVAQFGVCGKF